MDIIDDYPEFHRLTRPIEEAVVAGDGEAIAQAFHAVDDELVTALMKGFQPEGGPGDVYDSLSFAHLCRRHDRAELFVRALDTGARGLADVRTREAWLDVLCTFSHQGYAQGSCIGDSVAYGEPGARRQAQAVHDASGTDAAKATWAQGMALGMLEKIRVALDAPAR